MGWGLGVGKGINLHLKWSELPSLTEGMITGQRPTSRSTQSVKANSFECNLLVHQRKITLVQHRCQARRFNSSQLQAFQVTRCQHL